MGSRRAKVCMQGGHSGTKQLQDNTVQDKHKGSSLALKWDSVHSKCRGVSPYLLNQNW